MVFYSRLKHNVMVFCCWDSVFSGGCYSFLRLIICCEKRKECHRLLLCFILIVNVRPLLVSALTYCYFYLG